MEIPEEEKQYQHLLKEGQKLLDGTYLIEKVLGNGTFAQVYRALHVKKHKWVAIKQILRKLMQVNPKLISLYKSEVKILKMINDENVVRYIDHFTDNHSCFIVMEYCNQGNLEELLGVQKRLNEKTAVNYFKQILHGYKAIHEFKVVHRDLKAQNILIHQGILKIADFGFAKILQQSTKSILGTPATTAPEILRGVNYGFEVDVYSLGIVLYNMLFGEYPYDAVSRNWQNQVQMEQIQFQKNGVIISECLKDLLKRMICYSRQDRIKLVEIFQHPIFAENRFSVSMPVLPASERSSPAKIFHQRVYSKPVTMPVIPLDKQIMYQNVDKHPNKISKAGDYCIQNTKADEEIALFENKVKSQNVQLQPKKINNNFKENNSNKDDSEEEEEDLSNRQNSLSVSLEIPDELERQYTNQSTEEDSQSSPLKISAQRGIEFCQYQIKTVSLIFEILRLSMMLPKEFRCKFLIFLLSKKAYCTLLDIEGILSNDEPFFSKSQLEKFIRSGWYQKIAEKADTESKHFEKLYYVSRNEAIHELQENIHRRNNTEKTQNGPIFLPVQRNSASEQNKIIMSSCVESPINMMNSSTYANIHGKNKINQLLDQYMQTELCNENEECLSVVFVRLFKIVLAENTEWSNQTIYQLNMFQLRCYFLRNIHAIKLFLILTGNQHLQQNYNIQSCTKRETGQQSVQKCQQQENEFEAENKVLAEQPIENLVQIYQETLLIFHGL